MTRARETEGPAEWLKKAFGIAVGWFDTLLGKTAAYQQSQQLSKGAKPLRLQDGPRKRVICMLKAQLDGMAAPSIPTHWNLEEKKLADAIRQETDRFNRNNVTRTRAYLAFWRQHPEVHWSFLAHMVSRNGGWNMTDLKGSLLPELLDRSQIEAVFQMLEGSNSLIFRDAYPQLLLYRESKRLNRPLGRLLPFFGVSSFMGPFWQVFRESGDSSLLTAGLIVNEQSVIQKRILEDSYYKENVLKAPFLQAQALLQLNQVVFPYAADAALFRAEMPWKLAGLVLENFADRDERIRFGLKLYAILFGVRAVRDGAAIFADKQAHSGSRADYWPQLFTRIRHSPPAPLAVERLIGCGLMEGAEPLYSPELTAAWQDREPSAPQPGDWFGDAESIKYLRASLDIPPSFEITPEHCAGLKKLELAVLAANELNNGSI